jgi:hypothetical protein
VLAGIAGLEVMVIMSNQAYIMFYDGGVFSTKAQRFSLWSLFNTAFDIFGSENFLNSPFDNTFEKVIKRRRVQGVSGGNQ